MSDQLYDNATADTADTTAPEQSAASGHDDRVALAHATFSARIAAAYSSLKNDLDSAFRVYTEIRSGERAAQDLTSEGEAPNAERDASTAI